MSYATVMDGNLVMQTRSPKSEESLFTIVLIYIQIIAYVRCYTMQDIFVCVSLVCSFLSQFVVAADADLC